MVTRTKLKTYEAGLMQAKAYRALRNFMVNSLKKYDLTMMEWALIGYVSESPNGIRVGDLAKLMDVEMSLITNMINQLEESGYAVRKVDPEDRRARLVTPTKKCINEVDEIEKDLRSAMRVWMKDISKPKLLAYMDVLKRLSVKI